MHSRYDDDISFFGGCSCGVPNIDGIPFPCNHMCVVVKSYRIEGLNESKIMQYSGILPFGTGSILLILLYGLLLTLNFFVILQLLQNLITLISSYVHLIQHSGRVEGHGKRSESRG